MVAGQLPDLYRVLNSIQLVVNIRSHASLKKHETKRPTCFSLRLKISFLAECSTKCPTCFSLSSTCAPLNQALAHLDDNRMSDMLQLVVELPPHSSSQKNDSTKCPTCFSLSSSFPPHSSSQKNDSPQCPTCFSLSSTFAASQAGKNTTCFSAKSYLKLRKCDRLRESRFRRSHPTNG